MEQNEIPLDPNIDLRRGLESTVIDFIDQERSNAEKYTLERYNFYWDIKLILKDTVNFNLPDDPLEYGSLRKISQKRLYIFDIQKGVFSKNVRMLSDEQLEEAMSFYLYLILFYQIDSNFLDQYFSLLRRITLKIVDSLTIFQSDNLAMSLQIHSKIFKLEKILIG